MDFGADAAFRDVPKKLLEHYGIELCLEVIRKVTLEHAKKMGPLMAKEEKLPEQPGVTKIVAEAGGGKNPFKRVIDT